MPYKIMARGFPWVKHRPIHIVHHQGGPVAIVVESELCATGPLKLDGLQHCRPILLIERISRVNGEEAPLFLLYMLLPQEAHCVDA